MRASTAKLVNSFLNYENDRSNSDDPGRYIAGHVLT